MKKLLFFFGIIATTTLQAQLIFAPAVKWQFIKNDTVSGPTKIVETDNHHYVLIYENKISLQAFLEEIDSAGNVIWNKNIGFSAKDQQYGLGYYDLKKTSDGYIACGGFPPGSSLSSLGFVGSTTVVITKTDKLGNILWNKYYWYDSYSDSYALSIDLVGDSSYIVSGAKDQEGGGYINSFLMKIDTAGTELWWKNNYLNNGTVMIINPKVITLANGFGQLIICGLNNDPFSSEYFLRTNETGDSLYSYQFPLTFHPTSFAKSNFDQSLMFITMNWDNATPFYPQYFSTFKLDPNGLFLNQKNFSWPGHNSLAPDIQARNDTGFIALTTERITLAPSFYVRINENGDTLGIKRIDGISGHSYNATCFVPTADDGCVIAGPDDTLWVNNSPNGHLRVVKLGPDHWTATSVETLEKEKIDLNIYPNPTTGDITLELQNFTGKEDLNFCLYDVAGKLLMSQKVESKNSIFSLTDFPNGYYLYDVKNPKENSSGKGKLILIK